MRLVRHLSDMPFEQLRSGSVVTIGAYDGLHLGHEQLLEQVLAVAKERGMPSVVMSFEPMPKEFFSAEDPPARLMRFREKFAALAGHGIDIFYCPRFGKQMRDIAVDEFIRRILVHGLNTRHLVIGDDFRFAKKRAGSVEQLMRVSDVLGFTVAQIPSVIVDDIRVSSSAIRDSLWGDDTSRATRLLGRPYQMSGKVVMGEKLGRTLGFPTANVDIRRRQSAVMGVFAVRVKGISGGIRNAVANVGTRPTFNGTVPKLEVHIFDFDESIYGEYIDVEFIARLRGEKKFESIDDLVAQMRLDADNARSILSELSK
jgi:riboflavin kinase/FMN adenylyltransferase